MVGENPRQKILPQAPRAADPTVGKLVNDALTDVSTLVRSEIALAKAEVATDAAGRLDPTDVRAAAIDLAMIAAADRVVLLDRTVLASGTPEDVFASEAFARVFRLPALWWLTMI